MRTFIAVELPPQFEGEVAAVARQLSSVIEARYIPRENYHITLAFLGETSEVQVRDAIEAIEAAAAGMAPFPLKPDSIGKFGKTHNATLWLGIAKVPALMELAERIREELRARGVEFDDKAFLPHITLARHADIPNTELPQLLFPQETLARKVTLFKSTLRKDGAIYKPLHTVEWEQGNPAPQD